MSSHGWYIFINIFFSIISLFLVTGPPSGRGEGKKKEYLREAAKKILKANKGGGTMGQQGGVDIFLYAQKCLFSGRTTKNVGGESLRKNLFSMISGSTN